MLRRLSDPFWFQAFGCVLGFDWHSSGVTTTVTGALKEGLGIDRGELGLYAQGGKGATSRKTPAEIAERCDRWRWTRRRSFTRAAWRRRWTAPRSRTATSSIITRSSSRRRPLVRRAAGDERPDANARRYHWLSESLDSFVNDPHEAICSDRRGATLNLVASEHAPLRAASVELATGSPDRVMDVVRRHRPRTGSDVRQTSALKFPKSTLGRKSDPAAFPGRRRWRCRQRMRCTWRT